MLYFSPINDPEKGLASILSFGEIRILLDPGSDDLLSEFVELDFIPDLILFFSFRYFACWIFCTWL